MVETTHEDWTVAGYCPATGPGGEWCVLPAGHSGVTHECPEETAGRVRMFGWTDLESDRSDSDDDL